MWMMRRRNAQTREDGFYELLPFAAHFVDELIEAYRSEGDHGLRCWLLEPIGEARSPRALELLLDALRSGDESLVSWAAIGLMRLGTKDARRAVWEASMEAPGSSEEDHSRRVELTRIYEQYGGMKAIAQD